MSINRKNFRSWFTSQLAKLTPDREAGFVIVMISFPLLERYLRQKTGAEPKSPKFTERLLKIFPELGGRDKAQAFWTGYRHGLLHNVTMSRQSHGLTHDKPVVEIESNGKVWLNPPLFAQRVLDTIEGDFATFERGTPLPTVVAVASPPGPQGFSNIYLGTGTPPRR